MLTKESDRSSFEQFRSSTCHTLKDLGDIPFITQLLKGNQIRAYYNRKWYPETLYLLAMLDYLSNHNTSCHGDIYLKPCRSPARIHRRGRDRQYQNSSRHAVWKHNHLFMEVNDDPKSKTGRSEPDR